MTLKPHERLQLLKALMNDLAVMGLDLNEDQLSRLIDYLALLVKWNAVYNLTAIRDPQMMLTQHLADCLAIIKPIEQRWGEGRQLRIVDVGCGAGLPGMVLAIARPNWHVTGIDTVAKKVAFVQQVIAELRLPNAVARQERVERMSDELYQIAVCRAFSSVAEFVRVAGHLVEATGDMLAMKGVLPASEIAELPQDWQVAHVDVLQVPRLDAKRQLAWIRPAGIETMRLQQRD